jgi:hypothetical protein
MATLQERRLGYHSRAGLEPRTSRFSTLRLNHYAARVLRRGSYTRLGLIDECGGWWVVGRGWVVGDVVGVEWMKGGRRGHRKWRRKWARR